MGTMYFTQFILPYGRQETVSTEVPDEIEAKAKELVGAGFRFEIEKLSTGIISMDCCDLDGDQLAAELCTDGPEVPKHVIKLVNSAWEIWSKKRKTKN